MAIAKAGCENLILPFPKDLESPKWNRLKELMPADGFLHGIISWVLTDDQTDLSNFSDLLSENIDETAESIKVCEEGQELVESLSASFFETFSEILETIIPESAMHVPFIATVIYDNDNGDIYIIFNPDDEVATKVTSFGSIDLGNDDSEEDDSDGDEDAEGDDGEELDPNAGETDD